MVTARHISAASITARQLSGSPIGQDPYAIPSIALIGDSTTADAYHSRWGAVGVFARSDAQSLTAGDGTLTIYNDGTVTWAAPGDAAGARTAGGDGLTWVDSGTPDKGCCFNLTSSAMALGTESGEPFTITIAATTLIGGGVEAPARWGMIESGWLYEVTQYGGINGETTAGLLERMESAFTRDTFGRPLASMPGIVVVLIGINDVMFIDSSEPGYSAAATKANLTAIRDYITGRGATAIFGTLAMEAPTANQWSIMQDINAHIEGLAGSRCRVADYLAAVIDPEGSNGAALPTYMDATHYHAPGAVAAGIALAAELVDIAGTAGRSSYRKGGRYNSIVVNGAMAGDSQPTSWDIEPPTGSAWQAVFAGDGTIVASKEQVSGENDWQVYTITGATAGDALLVFTPLQNCAGGDVVSAEIEVQITADDQIVVTAALQVIDGDALDEYYHASGDLSGGDPFDLTGGVLHVDKVTLPSWFDSGTFSATFVLAAGNTTIKLRDAGGSIYRA